MARTVGAQRDTLEVDFQASYPEAQTILVEATALAGGLPIGTGRVQSTLAPSCSALELPLDGYAPPPDLATGDDEGAPDLALSLDLANGLDLSGKLDAGKHDAALPTDAATPPDAAQPLDLATAADLASSPDLATSPDLGTLPDLAPTPVITFGPSTGTTQYPAGPGTEFDDACPVGQVLTGFAVFFNLDNDTRTWVSQIAGVCSIAQLAPSGTGWVVHALPGTKLPGRGGPVTTDEVDFTCQPDQFMVGFHGVSGAYVDKIGFSCAPLLVAADLTVTTGTVVDGKEVGGTGGSPFPKTYCPANQVATVVRQRNQPMFPVDAFGFGCSQASIH
jgi:hypothetical protein